MLTPRGLGFLVFVLALLAFTLWSSTHAIALLCLTVLAWFIGAWLVFAVRVRLVLGRLYCTRVLHDDRGPVESLWAGRTFGVRVAVHTDGLLPTPYLRASDRVPGGVVQRGGDAARDGTVAPDEPLEFAYRLTCPAPGRLRFEGVRVQMVDLQGFFCHQLFLREPREYRVLPALADVEARHPTVKRLNLLPILGRHRHRRPGSGSELLDLRDYTPGDPPRMIAWKASARRDRLMTKEFESEVPIRCTLFVDRSASVRVGAAGYNPLARLVQVSAAVAQASAAGRDLPGLCLFDEHGVQLLRPARSRRHLIQMASLLADAAGLPAAPAQGPPELLLPLAYGFAEEVYPDLLGNDVNQVPAWLPWFVPVPALDRRPPTAGGRVYFWCYLLLALALFTLAVVYLVARTPVVQFALVAFEVTEMLLAQTFPPAPGNFLSARLPTLLAAVGAGAFALALGNAVVRRFRFVFRALPLFVSPTRRRLVVMRKRLAALFAVRYALADGGLAALLEDDDAFMALLQRFLAEHRVPYPAPLYEAQGRYAFAAPAKIDVLSAALLRAVGKGRDNELFVLLVDLLELDDRLGPLLAAVRVAVARHHQVLVFCPWPEGLPLPRRDGDEVPALAYRELLKLPLAAALERITVTRYHRAYRLLRRAFGKLGVPVYCAAEADSVQLILDRLERLRGMHRSRR
jgi:uncharacterized protein (DUF58 family)